MVSRKSTIQLTLKSLVFGDLCLPNLIEVITDYLTDIFPVNLLYSYGPWWGGCSFGVPGVEKIFQCIAGEMRWREHIAPDLLSSLKTTNEDDIKDWFKGRLIKIIQQQIDSTKPFSIVFPGPRDYKFKIYIKPLAGRDDQSDQDASNEEHFDLLQS